MSQVKHTIILPWTSFKIYLPDLEMWMSAHSGQSYCGNSADDTNFSLHFLEVPTQDCINGIEGYWAALEEHVEKSKIDHADKLHRVEAYARDNLVYLDMAQMSVAEKKMWMNRPLTIQDREDLAQKYPQI